MIEWEELVYQTAERFGGNLPHPETAKTIQSAYAKAPAAVLRAIDRVALEYEDGGIRSPWGILNSRVKQTTLDTASTTQANDRDKAIARAEQWLKTAGIHYDRETEILDELFGERGPLRHHDTPELRQRMLEQWHPEIGEQLEHEAQERSDQRRAAIEKANAA